MTPTVANYPICILFAEHIDTCPAFFLVSLLKKQKYDTFPSPLAFTCHGGRRRRAVASGCERLAAAVRKKNGSHPRSGCEGRRFGEGRFDLPVREKAS